MEQSEIKLDCKVLSSLEKVFPDSAFEADTGSDKAFFEGARGETIAFQLVFRSADPAGFPTDHQMLLKVREKIASELEQ